MRLRVRERGWKEDWGPLEDTTSEEGSRCRRNRIYSNPDGDMDVVAKTGEQPTPVCVFFSGRTTI